ncbi:MAG: transposase [Proteobacteria bacterium]|jgi:REP element-mobilizing transposase RayT|nr:transposase [Pseudomonadota bacterium]
MKQLILTSNEGARLSLNQIKARSFGGEKLKKRRKIQRPLVPGKVHHVVFKSSKAKGSLSFYTHKLIVARLLKSKARKFFVEIQDFVNMGNHLHLKVRFKDRYRFGQFLKSFAGTLARQITGAKKGKAFGRFWDGIVFTRVLLSSFEELRLRGYFEGNHRQRELGYKERENYLQRFNQFLYRLKSKKATSRDLSNLLDDLHPYR